MVGGVGCSLIYGTFISKQFTTHDGSEQSLLHMMDLSRYRTHQEFLVSLVVTGFPFWGNISQCTASQSHPSTYECQCWLITCVVRDNLLRLIVEDSRYFGSVVHFIVLFQIMARKWTCNVVIAA